MQTYSQTWIEETTLSDLGLGFLPESDPVTGHSRALVQVLAGVVGGEVPLRTSFRSQPKNRLTSNSHRGVIDHLLALAEGQ